MLTRSGSRKVGAAAVAAAALSACLVAGSPPAHADPPNDCVAINDTEDLSDDYEEPSTALVDLQIDKAHQLLAGGEPGEGAVVAVLDSGIVDTPALPVVLRRAVFTSKTQSDSTFAYYHGSAMAGLIAGAARPDGGLVGVAPGASLVDVKVYDAGPDQAADDLAQLEGENLVKGLDVVHEFNRTGHVDIANVSLAVGPSKALEEAVDRVTADGTIVVASSGNRPQDGDPLDTEFGTYKYGEDAARAVYPAGYAVDNKRVVAVSSTVPTGSDSYDYVLQSSAVTVAVPTALGVSYGVHQKTCILGDPATSYAAAEVSGILALLVDRFEGETVDQIVARLEDTAAGAATPNPAQPDKLTGLGIVQPYDALTRLVAPDKSGSVTRGDEPADDPTPAALPVPEEDVLRSTRANAVWWGLIGGGALIVAVLLRPVFARRRRPADSGA